MRLVPCFNVVFDGRHPSSSLRHIEHHQDVWFVRISCRGEWQTALETGDVWSGVRWVVERIWCMFLLATTGIYYPNLTVRTCCQTKYESISHQTDIFFLLSSEICWCLYFIVAIHQLNTLVFLWILVCHPIIILQGFRFFSLLVIMNKCRNMNKLISICK